MVAFGSNALISGMSGIGGCACSKVSGDVAAASSVTGDIRAEYHCSGFSEPGLSPTAARETLEKAPNVDPVFSHRWRGGGCDAVLSFHRCVDGPFSADIAHRVFTQTLLTADYGRQLIKSVVSKTTWPELSISKCLLRE